LNNKQVYTLNTEQTLNNKQVYTLNTEQTLNNKQVYMHLCTKTACCRFDFI